MWFNLALTEQNIFCHRFADKKNGNSTNPVGYLIVQKKLDTTRAVANRRSNYTNLHESFCH
jgi:hypothetical protein